MHRILIVDDEETVLTSLKRILKPEGYEVLLAGNFETGWEACKREKPDLAILDVSMPGGSGMDLCRKIKADPELKHIPVFILTGVAVVVESRVEGLKSGAEDYIVKPFNQEELLARIARTLKFHHETA